MRCVQYIIYVFIVLEEGKSIYDENQTKINVIRHFYPKRLEEEKSYFCCFCTFIGFSLFIWLQHLSNVGSDITLYIKFFFMNSSIA